MVQRYDPAFILAFSNHCLAMGYLEPTEFSRLGLLAISFVSISSPDEELRKLGYNCLGKFQDALKVNICFYHYILVFLDYDAPLYW